MGATTAVPYTPPLESLANAKSVPTEEWAASELVFLHKPVTALGILKLETWLHAEQSSSSWAANATNPLGVETNGKVQSQGNVLAGLGLTASTLQHYPMITAALGDNVSLSAFATAVVNSTWNKGQANTGTYNGLTPAQFVAQGPLSVGGTINNSLLTEAKQGPAGGVVTAATSGVDSLTGLISDVTNPAKLKNVGIFVLGVALVGVGLVLLLVGTEGKKVEQLVPAAVT